VKGERNVTTHLELCRASMPIVKRIMVIALLVVDIVAVVTTAS
jgi:hypothetical protein